VIFQRHRSLRARWRGHVLGDQRVAKFKAAEAAEVPIRGPQFADAMELTQRCHARIVDLRTGDSPIAHLRRSSAALFIHHFADALPAGSGRVGIETFAQKRSFSQPKRPHPLPLRNKLSQTLDYKNPQRRILARSDSLCFVKQRIRKLYGRLHMGVCIRPAGQQSNEAVLLRANEVIR
jgi:hypothetical protein